MHGLCSLRNLFSGSAQLLIFVALKTTGKYLESVGCLARQLKEERNVCLMGGLRAPSKLWQLGYGWLVSRVFRKLILGVQIITRRKPGRTPPLRFANSLR